MNQDFFDRYAQRRKGCEAYLAMLRNAAQHYPYSIATHNIEMMRTLYQWAEGNSPHAFIKGAIDVVEAIKIAATLRGYNLSEVV